MIVIPSLRRTALVAVAINWTSRTRTHERTVTSITIELPDDLAARAERTGVLRSSFVRASFFISGLP